MWSEDRETRSREVRKGIAGREGGKKENGEEREVNRRGNESIVVQSGARGEEDDDRERGEENGRAGLAGVREER